MKDHYIEHNDNITVEVIPYFVPERSCIEYNQFFYAYNVIITNNSNRKIKIVERHLKIKDGNGKTYDVKGSGVVGEQPTIEHSECFEYTSFCPLHSPYGNMRGSYVVVDESNNKFKVDLPLFFF